MKYIKLFENFSSPSTNVRNKLRYIVSDIKSKYKGGKPFFDALDDRIKDINNRDMIYDLVKGCENEWIATSGEFGDVLYHMYKQGKFKCKGVLVFNGKMLTQGFGVSFWYPKDFDISNKEYVYVDDSYFSGNTVNKIKEFLIDENSTIKNVLVIYDGSLNKNNSVKSFFRYYDE